MSIRDALVELERYHKGVALMIKAAERGVGRLYETAESTIRNRMNELLPEGELTLWAVQQAEVENAAECEALRSSLNYYVECMRQSARGLSLGRNRPSVSVPHVVRSPVPPQVGARRRRNQA